MNETATLFKEEIVYNGGIILYMRKGNNIQKIYNRESLKYFHKSILKFFTDILLPSGYPDSVSDDYLSYQIWDTVQAFCSTLTAAFTTRAILKGVGVGDSHASELAAAITWILKDGLGMIGRIIFAWWKGNFLDLDCKKWRFFADILNDFAMMIELFLPYVSKYSLYVLCLTSTMKSIVGIAGGATRASITHHQAIKDNMAEISAKDGSQETVVNLIGSFVSIFLLNIISNNSVSEIGLVLFLIVLHLLANYLAVKSLVFDKFNNQRLAMVIKTYLNIGIMLNTKTVNENESVILGTGLKVEEVCGFRIKVGDSLHEVTKEYSSEDFSHILLNYENKKYVIFPDLTKGRIFIGIESNAKTKDVIQAYFHGSLLAVAICIFFKIELELYNKRHLYHATPISRLSSFMKDHQRDVNGSTKIPITFYKYFSQYVDSEMNMFCTALELKDWNLESDSLQVGEYRSQWKKYFKKTL